MFGGGVNEAKDKVLGATEAERDVCVAGEACTRGTEGSADGEFEGQPLADSFIAVGPGGAVYVGDRARVQVFDPSGAWRENISLAGLSATGAPTALAVDSSGNVFVADEGVTGVHEFGTNGVEKATVFDEGSSTVDDLAVDGSGNLFVGDDAGEFHVLKYDAAGKEIDSFGSNTVIGRAGSRGMAFSEEDNALFASDTEDTATISYEPGTGEDSSLWSLPNPGEGPFVESESAAPEPKATVSFGGIVDTEGGETSYHFEYVSEAQYKANGFDGAVDTASASLKAGFEPRPASAQATKLASNTTYSYRLVASNSNGTSDGPAQTFTTLPAADIEGPWVTSVTTTSATFAANVNPLGSSSEYRLEYGPSESYGETLTGSVGEGTANVLVSYHRQDLQPGTTYYYRIVVSNALGVVESSDRTFTTQALGRSEVTLPDGRAWELVSPPDKKGALFLLNNQSQMIQAASNGNGIAYIATESVGEGEVGHSEAFEPILSRRAPSGGWKSQDIEIKQAPPNEGESYYRFLENGGGSYHLFSQDLSAGVVEQRNQTLQSPEAAKRTLYIRNNTDGTYLPLVTTANVPPGTNYGNEPSPMRFETATPDLSHVVFGSSAVLTAGVKEEKQEGGRPVDNLYEWSGGQLQPVNIFPEGESHPTVQSFVEYTVGSVEGDQGMTARAISNDGRWIVWKIGESNGDAPEVALYVRDMVDKKTLRIGGKYARFETMSADGSKIFFVEPKSERTKAATGVLGTVGGDLYVFDTENDTETDLTAEHGSKEAAAGVRDAVIGASEDGSYVYFVATGVLADGATSGADNLYMLHDDGNSWTTTYITTLSSEDRKSWGGPGDDDARSETAANFAAVSSRVSPNGRYLAFMSSRSLTGYDNTDALSGQPDEEVYLYDATTGHLACTSCNPSGARPVGVDDTYTAGVKYIPLLVDPENIWNSDSDFSGNHWLAGNLPGWRGVDSGTEELSSYQPRFLSNSGRLFFDSPEALVAQDTNGLEDVYEYEPPGVGDCTAGSATFGERSGGCVDLISSGTSSSESAFIDASENGNDVFFLTQGKLTEEDYDTSFDVYDAHVCSTEVPCRTEPVSSPPCTSGDSCKAAPSPQPEIFGATPSATFSGVGNVVEEAKKPVNKSKAKAKKRSKRHAKHKKRKGKKAARSNKGKATGRGKGR